MEIEEAIIGRRSVRKFLDKPVSKDKIQKILDLAVWAPSGMNTQNWYFVVLMGEKVDKVRHVAKKSFEQYIRASLNKMYPDRPEIVDYNSKFSANLGGAPVVVCVYRSPTVEGDLTDLQSVAAAIQNFMLVSYQEGLGACWMIGPVHLSDEIDKITGVIDRKLQAVIPLGYPDGSFPVPRRKEGRIEWIGWD